MNNIHYYIGFVWFCQELYLIGGEWPPVHHNVCHWNHLCWRFPDKYGKCKNGLKAHVPVEAERMGIGVADNEREGVESKGGELS